MTDPLNEEGVMPAVGPNPLSWEAHDEGIRAVWKRCLLAAVACFGVMGGIAMVMLANGHTTEKIVSVQLMLVYLILPVYAVGFAAPMLITSLMKLSMGLEMSREGLNVGKKTAEHIDHLQKELKGILTDVRDVVGPVKALVDDLKKQKTGKVLEFIEKLSTDGSVEKIAGALESIGERIHKAFEKVEKGAVDRMVDKI